jgi:cytochrome c556
MAQKVIRAALFAALGTAAAALTFGSAVSAQDKKDQKIPDIHTIMTEGHKGTDSFLAKIGAEARAGKWDDAKLHAKALVVFGEALGKNKPPKGEGKNWEALAKKYHENTKAVLAATEKKDAPGTTAALKAIQGSCMECHKSHKQ